MSNTLPTPSRSIVRHPDVAAKYSRKRRNNLAGYVFIAPWLIGFFVFTLAPLVASFLLAFTDYDILTPPRWIGFANFGRMFFVDQRYWHAVVATLYYVVASVPLRLVVALVVAILLNTAHRMIGLYRALLYVPSIVGGKRRRRADVAQNLWRGWIGERRAGHLWHRRAELAWQSPHRDLDADLARCMAVWIAHADLSGWLETNSPFLL